MDKSKLKEFAIYSREKLIEDVKAKARLLGITEEEIKPPLSESREDMYVFDIGEIETYRIYGEDVSKYNKLVAELEKREIESDYKTAYQTLVEEVAYTWFNRIIAIRFMEVNNYMPDKMRVLSSGKEGVREPEFITYYRDTDIGISDEEFEKLDQLKLDASVQSMDDLFQFMFIKQSNALGKILPELFEETDDYAELLLNVSYNDKDGVIYKLIEDVGEEAFDISKTGQIEIIGWLYQYYNTVPKQKVDKAKKKVDKNTLPAKTQLFTPKWIVKYMVQNSLGRLWIERKLAKGTNKTEEELSKEYGWEYYIPEAEQIEEVEIELRNIREDRKDLKVEDITFLDPSMGSGHILVYAFDVFMQFYIEEGYMEREAAELIIEKNLYGLDIDKRAYQLAYFSLMMKGREYSRRILEKNIKSNLYYFIDSKGINLKHIDYLGGGIEDNTRKAVREDILEIIELFKDGKELGSVIKVDPSYNLDMIDEYIKSIEKDVLPMEIIGIEKTQKELQSIINLLRLLSNRYHIVSTNPPYLGSKHMGVNLSKYLNLEYKNTKADLFAVFMEKCNELLIKNGYYGMINQHSWMFLSSFEKYRKRLVSENNIINMLHLGPGAFEEISGEVVQSTTFIIKKGKIENYIGLYIRLTIFKRAEEKKIKVLEAIKNPDCGYYYETNADNFKLIPGSPIAYWASNEVYGAFKKSKTIGELFPVKKGSDTGANHKYLRRFYELDLNNLGIYLKDGNDTIKYQKKWVPYDKGGSFRKWYGNNNIFIFWENDGYELRNSKANLRSKDLFFKNHITWNALTSSITSARYSDYGALFDSAGSSMFPEKEKVYLAYMNSKVVDKFLLIINPTLNYGAGSVSKLPCVNLDNKKEKYINNIVKENISISKTDWDSFETSWNFKVHPLLDKSKQGQIPYTIESAYNNWKDYANKNFDKLKENEERLNEIFIKIYGLEDELTPEVLDKDITIAKIFDDKKDIYEDIKGNAYILTKEDVVKSFISYGVGCIFGRYSLDEEGLVHAGGDFDINKYRKLRPVEDNIAIITDKEYFEDDLVNRFIEFVKLSFGEENLEENLDFIADSLKGKGTSREKIRNYFVNDFYKDHVKMYKKTPIYWLYDASAGKTKRQSQNSFKALIYMHRYSPDTSGDVRIDYLHKVQRVYERRIEFLKDNIANNENAKEVSKSEKELEKIMKQLKECKDYDEKIGHLALSRIDIDLDDGVKVNYDKVQTDREGKKYKILADL